jgi:hypothetical protein
MTIQDIVNFTNADSIADIAFDKLGDVTKFRELADFNGLDRLKFPRLLNWKALPVRSCDRNWAS